ncbi:MAG: hypothetical protein E6I08_10280 [Chloroflexi bacterium]|nr:MAG: hypothetical protein E6I08_10280 [Chloroflexota bacterium]
MTPAGGKPGSGPSGSELAGLSVAVAAAVIVPLVSGLLIDGAARKSPLFLFLGLAIGIIAAAAVVYTRFRRYL